MRGGWGVGKEEIRKIGTRIRKHQTQSAACGDARTIRETTENGIRMCIRTMSTSGALRRTFEKHGDVRRRPENQQNQAEVVTKDGMCRERNSEYVRRTNTSLLRRGVEKENCPMSKFHKKCARIRNNPKNDVRKWSGNTTV